MLSLRRPILEADSGGIFVVRDNDAADFARNENTVAKIETAIFYGKSVHLANLETGYRYI